MGSVSSPWKSAYERYGQLERRWAMDGAPVRVARQVLRQALHGFRDREAVFREARSLGLPPPSDELVSEALALQRILYPPEKDRPGGRHPDDPLEDVYAAALSMLPHGFWTESPDRAQLYRGQRDARWSTIPSIFRKTSVADALRDLGKAVAKVRHTREGLDEHQALAIAQHYSTELGVATWLLDVTWDPRVALFFASHKGQSGDIGTVTCVVRAEWERLSAGGTNRLGRLRVIEAPDVFRIERQRASFLDTSHPELFDQYVAHTVWFRQVDGLCFEDPDADHPVAEALLYPPDDPLLRQLRDAVPSDPAILNIQPASDASEALGAAAYWELAHSWCGQAGIEIDAYRADTLQVVCEVHAWLQQRRDEFGLAERSLLRLQHAVELIVRAQQEERFITPQQALRFSLGRMQPAQRDKLSAMINERSKARDMC